MNGNDMVELLCQRIMHAAAGNALNGGPLRLSTAIAELAEALGDGGETANHPAEQGTGHGLLGTEELAAQADEQARPVVQRILDGELGQDAALAMTRVVLDLTHARGEVKALEREAQIARAPWQVVDTGGGEPNA